MARPRLAGCAARRLALVLLAFRASCYDRPRVVRLHPGPRLAAHAEYEVSWTATDLGTADEAWIEFDLKHYQSMVNDGPRTALFLDELGGAAAYPPGTATVLDLGTGPFALFAKAAARLGARKVYAIEAVPAWRQRRAARRATPVLGLADVALPEGDLVIFEIAGSIAARRALRDAHRFQSGETSVPRARRMTAEDRAPGRDDAASCGGAAGPRLPPPLRGPLARASARRRPRPRPREAALGRAPSTRRVALAAARLRRGAADLRDAAARAMRRSHWRLPPCAACGGRSPGRRTSATAPSTRPSSTRSPATSRAAPGATAPAAPP
ncbi:protein-arginine omega-N asymmetric methyltransferase [Aureococcus anophagefferens]|nr:protein-arginine omega-N asymmetric methyltransferase [Aureococcus anophagefferens]